MTRDPTNPFAPMETPGWTGTDKQFVERMWQYLADEDEDGQSWHRLLALALRGAETQWRLIEEEVAKAIKKFPTWPTDPLHALAVLGEEFGELTKEMLQLTYEPHKTSLAEVKKEAIQTAAMALRLVASLDTYKYIPGEQHSQGIIPLTALGSPKDE